MAFRELVVEAVKKSTIMANSIIRRMNVAEWKNISRMTEMDADYISDLASFHMPTFDDLNDDDKKEVVEKIWNKLKSGEKPDEVLDENPEQKPLSQSELKQKIMDYVKQNGAVLYPLESAAENLASALASEETQEESEEEKCPCCGKSPCECGPDCKCKCKESVTEAITNIKDLDKDQFISLIKNKLEVALYDGGYSGSERGQILDGCTKLVKEYGLPEEDIKALESQYNVSLDDICPQCGNDSENCICGEEDNFDDVIESAKKEGLGNTFRKIGDQAKQSLKNIENGMIGKALKGINKGTQQAIEDEKEFFSTNPTSKEILQRMKKTVFGEPVKEATMNDIPHEIDDQIHTLKDMRFELEQTKKNWNIAGVETQPMDEVLTNIDGLIASLYQNGAKMADDEISKGSSETQEPEKEEE